MSKDILNRFQKGQGWTEVLRKSMAKVVTVQDTEKTYICSGSFIRYKSHNYVLTNKHCVEEKNSFVIRRYKTDALGNIDASRTFETIPINLLGKHPQYDLSILTYSSSSGYTRDQFDQLPYFHFYQGLLNIGQTMFLIGSGLGHELGVLPGMIANMGAFDAPNVSNENENVFYSNVVFTTCRSQPGNSGSGGLALEYDNNGNLEARIMGVLTWGMSMDSADPTGMVGFGWVQHRDTVLKGMQDIFQKAGI